MTPSFKTTSLVPNEDVTVEDCDLKSDWAAFKWGTESLGDMRRFRISHCRIRETRGGGFKILSADGARIHDIRIRDVTMENVDMPLAILLRSRLRGYRDLAPRVVGTIDGVRLTNVTATVAEDGRVTPATGVLVSGLPEHRVQDIRLRDVRISVPGGGAAADVGHEVPLRPAEYPEYRPLGVLPAFGAFLRHARGVRLDGVVLEPRAPDARPAIRHEDVVDLEIDGRPSR